MGVDFLIAGIQFLLVIIAFGNGAEGHRTLLGDDEESFSDDEEEVRREYPPNSTILLVIAHLFQWQQ